MIAYNLCLSTCLGSVDRKSGVGVVRGTGFDGEYAAGVSEVKAALEKGFHVAPTGCVFVDKGVREGIVVKMVSEILRMRVLLKNVLRANRHHPLYEHYASILEFNQNALKMVVNTTYGWVSV
ncbi:hypothetical protein BLSTO_06489 [Blastocystis sp. subtype 1]